MPWSTLKGTRYFVRKRAILIAVLALLVLSSFAVWSQITMAQSSTSSEEQGSSLAQAELSGIDRDVLLKLVKGTDVEFTGSSGEVPYYIVTLAAERGQVLGLVYLTTDVAPEWTYGYNSRVKVLVFVNQTGTIRSAMTWRLQESWDYLVTEDWMDKFVNRSVYEPLEVGQDVHGITSATVTSKAIASGVREAGRRVVDDYRAVESKKLTPLEQLLASAVAMIQIEDLVEATAAIGMFGAALIAYAKNDERLKYAVLGGAILFTGIYVGRMISIVDLTQLMWATLPPLFSNLYWYALYGSMLVTSFFLGRLYCGYLCPFGAFLQIINRISPLKRRVPIKIHSKLVYLKYAVLAVVTISVLAGNGWITGVEPFETFFFLRGDWWMWAIMIGAVIVSVPFNRFYCDYFCPAGAVLSLVGRARVKEIKRWPECGRCKVCEQTCPQGAIIGPRISVLECMNCRECEKNYLDAKVCPHYAVEKVQR